jgi:hypothetical protein
LPGKSNITYCLLTATMHWMLSSGSIILALGCLPIFYSAIHHITKLIETFGHQTPSLTS